MNLSPKGAERALSRLSEIKVCAQGQALRVAVEGGGCSGFQYEIKLDTAQDDDLVLGSGPEKVIIDSASLPFLENAVIDFSQELIGTRFLIENPNAPTTCDCRTSLSK